MDILSQIKDFLIQFIESVGYAGVFIAMVVEACLIPLPSEITMPLAGALAAAGSMNVHLAAVVGSVGNVVGSLMAYALGRKIPEPGLIGFLKKWGKFIFVSVEEYEKIKKWLHTYGSFVSFFSRLLPGVRTVVSLPAGVAKIPLVPFILWTFAGSLVWCYILVWVGYVLGDRWEEIEGVFRGFEVVIVGLFLVVALLFLVNKLRKK